MIQTFIKNLNHTLSWKKKKIEEYPKLIIDTNYYQNNFIDNYIKESIERFHNFPSSPAGR